MRAVSAAHLKQNMWLWMAILGAVAVAAVLFRYGSVAALLGSIVGILMMWKSDETRLAALAAETEAELAAEAAAA